LSAVGEWQWVMRDTCTGKMFRVCAFIPLKITCFLPADLLMRMVAEFKGTSPLGARLARRWPAGHPCTIRSIGGTFRIRAVQVT